jgi:uncharacterized membrane protein
MSFFNSRFLMCFLLAAFYFAAGVLHLVSPHDFMRIVPPFVPWPEQVVWFTGVCEIAGALGLMVPRLRQLAGMGLALYAICVFPANLYHAFNHIEVAALPSSWWYHAPRFILQPVLVWWALYCSGMMRWPFRER